MRLSAGAYFAFIVYGYRAAGGRLSVVGWAFVAALARWRCSSWITVVNLVYLLMQIAIAAEGVGVVGSDSGSSAASSRAEVRELGGVFLVVLAMVVGATFASALAWSGVGLIAFVPLVGLAVFPLQIAALLVARPRLRVHRR